MVDAVLFEMEGVVFETREPRLASLRDAVARHGLDVIIEAETVEGLSSRAAIVESFARAAEPIDDVLADLLAARAERAFSSRLATAGVALSPGAEAFIQSAAGGARLGVVTRASRADADVMLRLSGLADMFTVLVCADDTLDGKPSPEAYRTALDRLSRRRAVARGSVLALEDGLPGIRAARAAGLRCVAVGTAPPHVAIEADAYVASLEEQSIASLDELSRPGREQVQ